MFLAGTLSGGQIAGDIYEYLLTTDDGRFTLLAEKPLDDARQPVGIVGSVVENPADEVAGYQGKAKRAIWVARAIPLE